jgi:hypothetical protein
MTAKRRRELLKRLGERSTSPDGFDHAALERVLESRNGRVRTDDE